MATVTLRIHRGLAVVKVPMPAATTGRYAAKRAAEACGMDPERVEWALWAWDGAGYDLVPMDEPVADLEGRSLLVAMA